MNKTDRGCFANRRQLLKAAGGCSMMSGVSMMSTYLTLQATKAAASDVNPTDYKALVCLFLLGGNDSYNMLTPFDGSADGDVTGTEEANTPPPPNVAGEYGGYYMIRGGYNDGTINPGGLALSKANLTQISDPDSGRNFGLHPSMSAEQGVDPAAAGYDPGQHGVAKLYNDGNLSFVCNVGSLLERTDMSAYNARTNLPLGLYSHADLTRHWQTGVPDTRSQLTGWGGRVADILTQSNANPTVSSNISIGGVNVFQTGGNVIPYTIGTGGATVVSNYYTDYATNNRRNYQDRIFSHMVDHTVNQSYSNNLMAQALAGQNKNSIDAAIGFNAATNAVSLTTDFSTDSLSNKFKKIAQVVGAASTLGQKRQIFFITDGGWDNHNNVMAAQPTNLAEVSRAMKSFYDATVELGVQDQVTTFSASEFARTLTTNGQGSDHGWGGNQMVMGGAVDGGKMKGFVPSGQNGAYVNFEDLSTINVGRGRLIPTTAVDEMAADLAMWFGISNGPDLELVLPTIRRFFTTGGASGPLGLFT